jgi:lysozyme family protein
MSMTRFTETVLPFTLLQEGGVSQDPLDAGGFTDFGITLATWRVYMADPGQTSDDLRAITNAEKAAFYAAMFWNSVRGDDLPAGASLMVFDHGVMSGIYRSAIILQRACGAKQDGHIGPLTIAAAARASQAALVKTMDQLQETYYRSLLGFSHDGRGWLARLARRTLAAQALGA